MFKFYKIILTLFIIIVGLPILAAEADKDDECERTGFAPPPEIHIRFGRSDVGGTMGAFFADRKARSLTTIRKALKLVHDHTGTKNFSPEEIIKRSFNGRDGRAYLSQAYELLKRGIREASFAYDRDDLGPSYEDPKFAIFIDRLLKWDPPLKEQKDNSPKVVPVTLAVARLVASEIGDFGALNITLRAQLKSLFGGSRPSFAEFQKAVENTILKTTDGQDIRLKALVEAYSRFSMVTDSSLVRIRKNYIAENIARDKKLELLGGILRFKLKIEPTFFVAIAYLEIFRFIPEGASLPINFFNVATGSKPDLSSKEILQNAFAADYEESFIDRIGRDRDFKQFFNDFIAVNGAIQTQLNSDVSSNFRRLRQFFYGILPSDRTRVAIADEHLNLVSVGSTEFDNNYFWDPSADFSKIYLLMPSLDEPITFRQYCKSKFPSVRHSDPRVEDRLLLFALAIRYNPSRASELLAEVPKELIVDMTSIVNDGLSSDLDSLLKLRTMEFDPGRFYRFGTRYIIGSMTRQGEYPKLQGHVGQMKLVFEQGIEIPLPLEGTADPVTAVVLSVTRPTLLADSVPAEQLLTSRGHMEAALRQLYDKHANSDPRKFALGFFTAGTLADLGYSDISRSQLLQAYTKQLSEKPGQENLAPRDALAYFIGTVLGIQIYDNSDLNIALANNRLLALLDIFNEQPELVLEALRRWPEISGKNISYEDLIEQFAGLTATKGEFDASRPDRVKPAKSKRELWVDLIADRDPHFTDPIDRDISAFANEVAVMMRLSRKDFDADQQGLIDRLAIEQSGVNVERYPRLGPNGCSRLVAIYDEVIRQFKESHNFAVLGLRTSSTPFGYQREGIKFLTDRNTAILADEAGLGKTLQGIGTVETLRERAKQADQKFGIAFWVSTLANLDQVKAEILLHTNLTDNDVLILEPGKQRDQQLKAIISGELKPKYVLANYERLRSLPEDQEVLKGFNAKIEVMIVDEAQKIDKDDSLRSLAVRSFAPQRAYFLTATPYQSDPTRLFTLLHYLRPKEFPSFNEFIAKYPNSGMGAVQLRKDTADLILRRTKAETSRIFRPASETPFLQQIAEGGAHLPKRVMRDPIPYELTQEQHLVIARIISNFPAWVAAHNKNQDLDYIDPARLNQLNQLHWIRAAMYEPAKVGLPDNLDQIMLPLRRRVEQITEQNKKLILWVANTSVLEKLRDEFSIYNVALFYGDNVKDRAEDLARFQTDPSCRILIANTKSAAIGLNVNAADEAIFVQMPETFPELYQAINRVERVITLLNHRFAKAEVGISYVIPRYNQAIVNGLKNEGTAGFMRKGTITEQQIARLKAAELYYRILMEGYRHSTDPTEYLNMSILRSLREVQSAN